LWLGKLVVAKVGAKDARTCERDGGQDGLHQQPGVDLSNRQTVLIALHFSTSRVPFAVTSWRSRYLPDLLCSGFFVGASLSADD
jgi:hypothetical protein